MLPTVNAPRPGSRYRSATNRSVLSKATNMVASKLTWSARNKQAMVPTHNSYTKKHDDSHIAIDTSYLSNNISFADSKPIKGKGTSWHKLKKKANRAFLDQPWLLPTIVGSSFISVVLIIFFTIFSGSETHGQISNTSTPTMMNTPVSTNDNININNNINSEHEGAHRTMRKKYSRSKPQPKSHNPSNYKLSVNKDAETNHYDTGSRFSLEKSVDYVFNLFHNNDANRWNAVTSLAQKYCIDMPHFTLENQDAIDNLKGNIGTLVFDLVKFNPIYTDVTPENVVISNKGTFVAAKNVGSKYSQTATSHCDLVSHLFQLANDLGMLHPATKESHDFDTDSTQFWQEHKGDINHKTINQDVATLFDHATNNEFYEISMELPKLVEKHCAHTKVWISDLGSNVEEHFYNSLSRAIFTVNNAETSEVSDNVIGFPVIDSNGDLMQLESGVLTFDKNDIESHKNLHYSRCELLDKIVFHGLTMSMNKHIDFMYDAAQKDDFYGFEILADLLDTEYCNIINTKLSQNARNNLGLHLWSLVKDIINGEFHLSSDIDDESNQYIITSDGGIMHSQVATQEMKLKKSQIIHCSMVKELIKRGIKYHSGNHDYYHMMQNNDYDKDQFEHRYDDSGLSDDLSNEMSGEHTMANQKQLKIDAQTVIAYLRNGQETEFVKLLDYLLEQYHAQWFSKIEATSDYHGKRSVKLMIEQTLHSVILGKVNLSSQYDPNNDLTILRKDVNELEVIHQNDLKTLSKDTLDNLERLPLLDEIFKQVMNEKQ